MRALVIAGLVLLLLIDLLGAFDDEPTREFGSGARVAEVLVPHTASPSPNDHALTGLAFELVKYQPRPRRKPTRPILSAAGSLRGFPCGGRLPDCFVLRRESLMARDPLTVWNGNCYYPKGYAGQNPCGSTASGVWQVLRSTWARFKGYLNAADAPLEVQNEKAALLWDNGRGCAHWAAC